MDNQYNTYQPPVNPQPVDDGKNLSIVALVCGIVSIIVGFIPVPFFFILILGTAVVALILGIMGRGKSVKAYGKATGLATAGLVLGIIAIALSPFFAACNICTTCTVCALQDASNQLNNPSYSEGLINSLS